MKRLVTLLLIAASAAAQAPRSTTLRVVVVDSSGSPLGDADVRVAPLGLHVRANSDGQSLFSDLPAGQLSVKVSKIGYTPQTAAFSSGVHAIDTLRFVLPEIVYDIQGMRISAAQHPFVQEYERRRAMGIGTFITPKEITERNASNASEIFRQVPSLRFVQVPGGYGIRFPVVLSIDIRGSGECIPVIWVDGQRALGLEIDEIGAQDILAVEIYRGAASVPSRFTTNGKTQCGAIIVWTRRQGADRRRP